MKTYVVKVLVNGVNHVVKQRATSEEEAMNLGIAKAKLQWKTDNVVGVSVKERACSFC